MTQTSVPDSLTELIRPSVRSQKPYLVPGFDTEPDIKLNQNESPFDIPDDLKRELLDTFLNTPFNRYPKEHPYRLRDALAERLNHPPEGILIGNGSNELTHTLGLCLIDKDIPVVLPSPMFSLYTSVVKLFGGRLVTVPAKPDLHFDIDGICTAMKTHSPSLTVVTTPNNPTGLAIPLSDIKRIASTASGFVLIDEAYVEFTEEESAFTILADFPNLILLRTFSKAFGLAGLRLGYLIAHPDVIYEFLKSRVPFMTNRMAEVIALGMLKRTDLIANRIDRLKASCRHITEALQARNDVDVVPSQTNFVIFKTTLAPDVLMKKLSERGVLVRNMIGYSELAGYLRVNAGSAEENKAFLRALEDAL